MMETKEQAHTVMQVLKRNGQYEKVDLNKIVKAVDRCCDDLERVDAVRVATRTIGGLYDGASTKILDQLSIQTAAGLVSEEPQYSKLASRLLATTLHKEVQGQGIFAFTQGVEIGYELGLCNQRLLERTHSYSRKIHDAIDHSRDGEFEYFGLRTLADRYLLRHPQTRELIETPQAFWMRIALANSEDIYESLELYERLSRLEFVPSSPTLFNSGTQIEQLSSCFLLDSPQDDLKSIYKAYTDIAMLSKYSGGIGIPFHRVRSQGSLIRSTNGFSSGIMPFLKTLDASVSAVNQGGKRKGACCVYLESWHADVESFLEARENTGDHSQRTYNLNLANWVSDLFMKRVEAGASWSLFDPKEVPELVDLYAEEFEQAYVKAEKSGLAKKTMPARDLFGRMMRCLAQTGNGWMCFKDHANCKSNQVGSSQVIHHSNLCTEILEVTDKDETAVCNLASINLAKHCDLQGQINFEKLRSTVQAVVPFLDRVIDINAYPIPEAANSNKKWRPVGLGIMGFQDVLFRQKVPFDDPKAQDLARKIQEEIYFSALTASLEMAKSLGPHPNFSETKASRGLLQMDLWEIAGDAELDWEHLKDEIQVHGLRNSLLIAIAPTATISSIAGCFECIEPQVSNIFKRETLSGDFIQINRYLIQDLQKEGLWNESMKNQILRREGSIQAIPEIPESLKNLYKTAWELPMRSIIDIAAARAPFIDQSQSLNLFMEQPNIGALSSMYVYAWKKGLKTTYYLRSRPATQIAKTLQSDAVTCSLENPESCEACQ